MLHSLLRLSRRQLRTCSCKHQISFSTSASALAQDNTHESHSNNDVDSETTPTTNQTNQLLSAALLHVPDLGWSEETLNAAARDINLSLSEISLLVPHGPIDLVHHFIRQSNESLSTDPSVLKYLQDNKEPNKDPNQDTNNDISHDTTLDTTLDTEQEAANREVQKLLKTKNVQSVAERLNIVSKARLEMIVPYLEHGHWLNAMALSALPQNAESTSRLALETIDQIWYVAGDRSMDYKWYTRRAGLVPGYCATELYLLSDESKNYNESWEFLDWHVNSVFSEVAFQANEGDGNQQQAASMMDTMSVAGKGAVSFASALASIGGDIMRETSSLVGDKLQERKERKY
jgi:rpsU-divergently transcribed protein